MARRELYKAVKYEVEQYGADCGMTLLEMWNTVNGRTELDSVFWYRECLKDYRNSRSVELPNRWWEPGCEDMPKVAPKEQWIPDDVELPFM